MDKILIKCEKLDDFGRGIGFYNGKSGFRFQFFTFGRSLCKDRFRKEKIFGRRSFRILKVSPDRVEGRCPYEKDGCSLKHLKYEKALEYKENKVKNILSKFAGINSGVRKIVPSPKVWSYRNKITLKVYGKVGYYKNE